MGESSTHVLGLDPIENLNPEQEHERYENEHEIIVGFFTTTN